MRTRNKIFAALLAGALPLVAIGIGLVGSNSTGLAPEAMRGELAEGIVQRWAPYVERRYGSQAGGWSERMQRTLQSTDIGNLEYAASAGTFEQMNAALLGGVGAADRSLGPQSKMLGQPGSDLVYTPLNPCRIVDTRVAGGQLAMDSTRSFKAFTTTDFTAQGGAPSNCSLPQNVSALTVKITAVFPNSGGYFTAYPFDEAKPLASSLNYVEGSITSDDTHIMLCRPGCPSEFNVYSTARTDVVIDVTGYFIEPAATALDCTVAQESGNLALLSGVQAKSVDCPAGYTATGGGCGGVLGIAISNSEPKVVAGRPVGWKCDLVGSLIGVLGYQVNSTCCRVPGR